MPGLFTTIILVAAVSPPCRCFKPVTVSEQGREIPAWTSYRYLDTPAPAAETLVREYVLQEQDQVSQQPAQHCPVYCITFPLCPEQRTYLLCPRGYSIGQVAVALLLGKDQIEENEHMRHKTAVFRCKLDS